MRPRIIRNSLLVAISLVLIAFVNPGEVTAQQTAAPADAPSSTERPAATGTDQGSNDSRDQEIRLIRSGFVTLRVVAYAALAAGLMAGLLVYVRRRGAWKTRPKTWGAVTAALVSIVLFCALVPALSGPETSHCASAVLREGSDATEYDDICRESRERAANAFGLTTAFRASMMHTASSYIVPIGAGLVKVLTYVSVPLAALAGFFILQPLSRRLFVPH